MTISIIPVSTKKHLKQFIMLPFSLYKNDPNWVPPLISEQYKFLDPKKNPFFEHSEAQLFLALKDDKVVGRISAHTNTRHNETHKDNIGFFGFYEAIDDRDVATCLFETAENWLKKKGKNGMRGPMNFSLNDECGTLIDGFNTPPFVMMTHNKDYYPPTFDSLGLQKAMDVFAYYVDKKTIPERLEKFAEMVQKRYKFTVRCLSADKKEMKKDLETVMKIYTEAWKDNWGFVPMSEKEFEHIVAELLPIAERKLVFIAEVNGKPAGFSVALPNYNVILKKMNGHLFPTGILKALYYKNKINAVRVLTMGVIKEYHLKGIDSVMIYHSFKNGFELGYHIAELSWVLETNKEMNNLAERLDAEKYKKYRLYEKMFV